MAAYCRFCLTAGERCEAVSVVHGSAVCVQHLAFLVCDPAHAESEIVSLVMAALNGGVANSQTRPDAAQGPESNRLERPDEPAAGRRQ